MASSVSGSGSRIGQSTTIRGSIRGAGSIELDGRVEGTIDVDGDVTIGGNARIKSPVTGARVTVRGAVAGNVRGKHAVVLEEGARVVGDLIAPQIGIRPGGLLRGHVSSGDALTGSDAVTQAPRAARAPVRHAATPLASPRPQATPRPHEAATLPMDRKNDGAAARTQRATAVTAKMVEPTPSPLTKPARSAPAPIMPTLQKGAKAALKKKAR
jgi:cytoskeletal protein CcmA (bactofilin family)